MFFQNFSTYLQVHMTLQPRIPALASSQLLEPEISQSLWCCLHVSLAKYYLLKIYNMKSGDFKVPVGVPMQKLLF
jgi:hypothetical protein